MVDARTEESGRSDAQMPTGPPDRIDYTPEVSRTQAMTILEYSVLPAEGTMVGFPLHYLLLEFPGILDI